jgi:cytochrome P450
MCIGWRFALNEAKIALVRLHQRFSFELRPGQVGGRGSRSFAW